LAEAGCGEPIASSVTLDIADGEYKARYYSPVTGMYSLWTPLVAKGGQTVIETEFTHDVVIQIKRR
jgi:hypothetical protein